MRDSIDQEKYWVPHPACAQGPVWLTIRVKGTEERSDVVVIVVAYKAHCPRYLPSAGWGQIFIHVNALGSPTADFHLELRRVPDLSKTLFGYLLGHNGVRRAHA